MIRTAARLLLAAILAVLTGAVSLWLLGTSWWSWLIAALSAVASLIWSLRTHRREVPRG